MTNVFKGDSGTTPDASTAVKGVSKTSVAPASSTDPIAVGDNDPRVTADQATGTASVRTLGTGAVQAATGNHTHAGGSPPFSDSLALVQDNIDSTKKMNIECSSIGTGQWRTLTMANADVNLTADQAAGVASLRTLGTGATQAPAGNDSRLSDARTPTAHTTSHNIGGSDPVQRFIEKDFIFQGALPTTNGTTTGTLRVPLIVDSTIVGITVTINALPVGAGSSQTLDLLRSGTTVYTTSGNRPSFVPGGSQFITATLPDVTALTGGTHYITANLVTAGSPSSGGTSIVMTVRYRQ